MNKKELRRKVAFVILALLSGTILYGLLYNPIIIFVIACVAIVPTLLFATKYN